MNKNCLLIIVLSFFVATNTSLLLAQTVKSNESKDHTDKTVTVKGRLVQNNRQKFKIDFTELSAKLNQVVQAPQPTPPENWEEMSREQRAEWQTKFVESAAGKALIEKRKKIFEAAAKFDLNVEDNGNFVVYDVEPGTYGMRGRAEKELGGKLFVFEVFGEIQVKDCLLYTSPSPRDQRGSRMPSSA